MGALQEESEASKLHQKVTKSTIHDETLVHTGQENAAEITHDDAHNKNSEEGLEKAAEITHATGLHKPSQDVSGKSSKTLNESVGAAGLEHAAQIAHVNTHH